MQRFSRLFRLFISSTFSDFHEERNALQNSVFPRINEYCRSRGTRFQAIDLRWGVSEAAMHDRRTMEICLEEVRRCRLISPHFYFLALLGDRYGAPLLPETIPAQDCSAILSVLSEHERNILLSSYQRDDNSLLTTYNLLPADNTISGKGMTNEEGNRSKSRSHENILYSMLAAACAKTDISDETRLAIVASPTEREFEEALFRSPNSKHAALCYIRKIEGAPFKYKPDSYFENDSKLSNRLVNLKERIYTHFPESVHEFSAHWKKGHLTADHLVEFCAMVSSHIQERIDYALAEEQKFKIFPHPIQSNPDIIHFIGREEALSQIETSLVHGSSEPLVVVGIPGVGKTTLLARAAADARLRNSKAVIIERAIGVSPNTTDVRSLLDEICQEIAKAYYQAVPNTPNNREVAVKQLLELLSLASQEYPLQLFIDALDQLRDADYALRWLPLQLPQNVHLVISIVDGPLLDQFTQRFPNAPVVRLTAMSIHEGADLLDRWLKDANRRLQPSQREVILTRFAKHGLPLYLRLAFVEARRWTSYQDTTDLADDVVGLLNIFFSRLETPSEHGRPLTFHVLGLLAAARYGLTEDELLAIISSDQEILSDVLARMPVSPAIKQMPLVLWARLYIDLEPYLSERQADNVNLYTFYHRQVAETVANRYLGADSKMRYHRQLANYFDDQPLFYGEGISNIRKLSELPYQLSRCERNEELKNLLTNATFLEAKIAVKTVTDVLLDISLLNNDPILHLLATALRLGAPVLNERPDELEDWVASISGPSLILKSSQRNQKNRLRLLFRSLAPADTLLELILIGHSAEVEDCVFSPDGRWLLSASRDKTLRLWDLQTGETAQIFEGHEGIVNACAFSEDGRYALSVSDDGIMRQWDVGAGVCIKIYQTDLSTTDNKSKNLQRRIIGCAWSSDGKYVLSIATPSRLWNVATGECVYTFTENEKTLDRAVLDEGIIFAIAGNNRKHPWLLEFLPGTPIDDIFTEILRKGHTFDPDFSLGVVIFGWNSLSTYPAYEQWLIDNLLIKTKNGISFRGPSIIGMGDGDSKLPFSMARAAMKEFIDSDPTFNKNLRPQLENVEELSDEIADSPNQGDDSIKVLYLDEETDNVPNEEKDELTIEESDIKVTPAENDVVDTSDINYETMPSFSLWHDTLPEYAEACLCAVETGEIIRTLTHQDNISDATFSLDGRFLVTASWDRTLILWDMETLQAIHSYIGHGQAINSCQFSPDGTSIASASNDNTVRLWRTFGGEEDTLTSYYGHYGEIQGCAISPNGKYALSASADYALGLWNVETGERLGSFPHHHPVNACAFSADGKYAVSVIGWLFDHAFGGDQAPLWDMEKLAPYRVLDAPLETAYACAFSQDGRYVAIIGDEKEIYVYDFATGDIIRHLQGIGCLAISPDSTRILSGSAHDLALYDIATGQCVRKFTGHTDSLTHCAFSSGGTKILSSSSDRTLRLWDVETGLLLKTLSGHTDAVNCCAISPNEKYALSASRDRTLRLWDIDTGSELTSWLNPSEILCCAFHPDGQRLMAGDLQGNVHFFFIEQANIIAT